LSDFEFDSNLNFKKKMNLIKTLFSYTINIDPNLCEYGEGKREERRDPKKKT